jgi:photosystem II stability/assembly factor-like uncharacterized protein
VAMTSRLSLCGLAFGIFVSALLLSPVQPQESPTANTTAPYPNNKPSLASAWRTVELPARPLNVAENSGTLWVCGADELIAESDDGGKTWTAKHTSRNGGSC